MVNFPLSIAFVIFSTNSIIPYFMIMSPSSSSSSSSSMYVISPELDSFRAAAVCVGV